MTDDPSADPSTRFDAAMKFAGRAPHLIGAVGGVAIALAVTVLSLDPWPALAFAWIAYGVGLSLTVIIKEGDQEAWRTWLPVIVALLADAVTIALALAALR